MSDSALDTAGVAIRERFLRAYANLPLAAREEVVVALNGDPVTWKAAYFEITNDTQRGQEILNTLETLKII